jgi:hypothetical protein
MDGLRCVVIAFAIVGCGPAVEVSDTQPLTLDLAGSTFASTQIQSITDLPGDPIPASCPI